MSTAQQNKIAIVTGGGSGIGLAIAGKLVQRQVHTIIVGRDEAKLAAAKAQLGGLCSIYSCDLSQLSAIPNLIADIVAAHGRIDILVNNAGINMKKNSPK